MKINIKESEQCSFCNVAREIIKVCRRTSEDLSVFVVFLIIFILSYFSLQQIFSNDFSLISQPISIKFGRFIVLDETKSLNIISSQ